MTGDFTSRASSQTTESLLDKRVRGYQRYIINKIVDEIYTPLLILNGIDPLKANLTISFETGNLIDLTIDNMMGLKNSGSITVKELREWVKDRAGVDLFDDKEIEAKQEEYEQQKQDMMSKDKPEKENPDKKDNLEVLRNVFKRKEEILKEQSKKKRLIEAEDDCSWVTINGAKVCIKDGESPEDALNRITGKTGNFKSISSKDFEVEKEKFYNEKHGEDVYNAYHFRKEVEGVNADDLRAKLNPTGIDGAYDIAKDLPNTEKRADAVDRLSGVLSKGDYSDFKKQISHEDSVNQKLTKVFDEGKYVYRGVSSKEFENIKTTGKFSSEEGKFGFSFATHSPEKASGFGDYVLKIDKTQLGDNVKPLLFSQFSNQRIDFKTGVWSNYETEFAHMSVAIKSGSSDKSIVGVYKKK